MWLFVTVPIQQTSRVDSVLAESHSSPQLRTRSGSVLAVTAFKTDGMVRITNRLDGPPPSVLG
ncbi:hypothetical protein Bca101_076256 [Brassica carinata]